MGSDGNDVNEPIEALTESATGTVGYAQNGTINLSRYSPGGGSLHDRGDGRRPRRQQRRPPDYRLHPTRREWAIGTDPVGTPSDSGDGNKTNSEQCQTAGQDRW